MDIVRFANIYRYDETGVRRVHCRSTLRFAYEAPRSFFRLRFHGTIIWQLDDTERKIALSPTFAPSADHSRKQQFILFGPLFIRFSLIPNGAANGERHQRLDHSVIDR